MTVWRAGMEAVVVSNYWIDAFTGLQAPNAEVGDVFVVRAVKRLPRDQRSLLGKAFGKRAVFLDIKGFDWVESTAFRPALRDDAEVTARIRQCKPAPAQPHEAEALVPTGETSKPSRLASGVAAAGDATVSNRNPHPPTQTADSRGRCEAGPPEGTNGWRERGAYSPVNGPELGINEERN